MKTNLAFPFHHRRHCAKSVLCLATMLAFAAAESSLNAATPEAPRINSIRRGAENSIELEFSSVATTKYRVQGTVDFKSWTELGRLTASGGTSLFRDTATAGVRTRFYRVGDAPDAVATMPVPGQLYPEATRIGGPLFGIELTIPPKWKGGLKQGTSVLIFGSDTEPGLVLGLVGFAWTKEEVLNEPSLRTGFEMDMGGGVKLFFVSTNPSNPLRETSANRLQGDFQAQTFDDFGNLIIVYLGLDITIHPSGGMLGFMGFTTSEYMERHKSQLKAFGDSVKTTPRPTNTEYMAHLNGKSFRWSGDATDWYSNQPGIYSTSAGLSSWSQNHASFCGEGTFEVSTVKETFVSVNSPTTGFSSLSGNSNTREYGQWTIVQSPEYGNLLMMVTLSGFQIIPVRVEPNGAILVGQHRLDPEGTIICQ